MPSVANAALTLDGHTVHSNDPLQVDPGPHIVAGTAPGHARTAQTITLARAETRRVDLRLEKAGGSAVVPVVVTIIAVLAVGAIVAGIVLATSHEAAPYCGTLNECIMPQLDFSPRVVLPLLITYGLAACSAAQSQILLWLDTDLSPSALPKVRVRCGYDWDGATGSPDPRCTQTYTRTGAAPTILIPGSLGFTGDPSRPNDVFTIVLDDGSVVPAVQRTLRVVFLPQQTAQVTVVLSSGCRTLVDASAAQPCPQAQTQCTLSQSCAISPGTTCGNDAICRSVFVASGETVVVSTPITPEVVTLDATLDDSNAV